MEKRRKFAPGFKLEAVRLIKERGVSMRRRQRILGFSRPSCAIG
jgi:transposase-like protein